MRTLIGNILKANKLFHLIENNDKIAVGVSGGKDSMSLLFCLSKVRDIVKKYLNWDIEVIGIHLKMNLCHIDYDPIINFFKEHNITFILRDTEMGDILRNQMKKGKIQCSLCSKMKKAILIEEAKKYGCNKVAMGHHADDAIETLFMNMVNEGRIATFKPKMYLDRMGITFIRPLILVREKDIISASRQLPDMPIVPCGCPMEGFTTRDYMKDFLDSNFYHNPKFKNSYHNFLTSLLNSKEFDLWFKSEDDSILDFNIKEINNTKIKYMEKEKKSDEEKMMLDDISDFE
ncbi:tRNA 2-thiocytidine biosynthesis TtcA family protein [Ureaplasma canigenitalium]|uniref:tRNA 2-thiocytidine biosynthesis TtcA family protein n=1 Tax=Ureaplasma canigenitalium TaxID=42092 RepID=UPI0009FF3A89|nr:tRNA 2-thiocytidine biosynthesis TtcA family protein [Ureaplasma canigenitalium]